MKGVSAPLTLTPAEVTVVVPVWNDSTGVQNLLSAIRKWDPEWYPAEVILIDDGSNPPLHIDESAWSPLRVRILRHDTSQGAGAARNRGVEAAKTEWILFLDSDCIPEKDLLYQTAREIDGALGYVFKVLCVPRSFFSHYYDEIGIFQPPLDEKGMPVTFLSGASLVWKKAFLEAGGFLSLPQAGGEDTEITRRLKEMGRLKYLPNAVVWHDVKATVGDFWRRFHRYGRAAALVEKPMGIRFNAPIYFRPHKPGWRWWLAEALRWLAAMTGYARGKLFG